MTAESEKPRAHDNIAVRAARDIDVPAREWLQHLFGRLLSPDEKITFVVATPHEAPAGGDRQAAFRNIDRVLGESARNMEGSSDDEFNAALDDAMEYRRVNLELQGCVQGAMPCAAL